MERGWDGWQDGSIQCIHLQSQSLTNKQTEIGKQRAKKSLFRRFCFAFFSVFIKIQSIWFTIRVWKVKKGCKKVKWLGCFWLFDELPKFHSIEVKLKIPFVAYPADELLNHNLLLTMTKKIPTEITFRNSFEIRFGLCSFIGHGIFKIKNQIFVV